MYIIQSNQIFDLRFFPRLNQRIKIFSILVKNSPSYSNFNLNKFTRQGIQPWESYFFWIFYSLRSDTSESPNFKIWITRWMLNKNLKFVKPLVNVVQAGSI